MSENQLTAEDVLSAVAARAQECREEGDGDMRNILALVSGIRELMREGKTRAEILAVIDEESDDE